MIRKERKLYRDGRKNPDGYRLKRLIIIKKRKTKILLAIATVFMLILHFLDVSGLLTDNKLYSITGIIDGVKKQNSNFTVYYLDVEQSDCSIIVCDGEVLIVDTGILSQVHNVEESLFSLEIDDIDYMVVTHPHDDHMAGASKFMDKHDVKNIIMPQLSETNFIESPTYLDLINKIAIKNVNPVPAVAGDSFMVGSAKVDILAPLKQDKDLNNMSVVLKVTYGETSFLFQGDAGDKVEKQIIGSGYDIDADVIKLGHHGSNTASSNEYLKKVNPKYAVVSSGLYNNFGHPSTPVINRIEENDIEIYLTSVNGNIIINSDGKNIYVKTERS